MKHPFDVPESKKIRLIINTDAKNEADDQYAIVHALLTPSFEIKGITAAHFGPVRSSTSMEDSYEEVLKVLDLMGLKDQVRVNKGAAKALPSEETIVSSEGADFIIEEALKEDDRPLYVAFLGPITDLAVAYLKEPKIADRLTALWIGCGPWPHGGYEFNLYNDIHAANVVLASQIPLWIVPRNVYRSIRASFAELAVNVKPYGKIGEYLFQQMLDFNSGWLADTDWPFREMWHLGDSPIVSLLLDEQEYDYELRAAPRVAEDMYFVHYQNERLVRWYERVDSTFLLQDMYAKLKLHYG